MENYCHIWHQLDITFRYKLLENSLITRRLLGFRLFGSAPELVYYATTLTTMERTVDWVIYFRFFYCTAIKLRAGLQNFPQGRWGKLKIHENSYFACEIETRNRLVCDRDWRSIIIHTYNRSVRTIVSSCWYVIGSLLIKWLGGWRVKISFGKRRD